MSIGMILLIALSLTGSAAVAAVLDVRRRARRLEADRHEMDLQRWDDECGVPMPRAAVKQPA